MKMKYIKQELLYGIYSNTYLYMTLTLCILFSLIILMNYGSVIDTYQDYLHTQDFYEENNLDIEGDLAGEYTYEKNGNVTNISNTILYYKTTVSKYIYAASSHYRLTQLLETSIIFFSIFFGAMGSFASNYDYKYRTIKIKTVRLRKADYVISKQIALMISSFFILLIALIVGYIVGIVMYRVLSTQVPLEQFNTKITTSFITLLPKFAFAYMIALLYSEFGFTLGVIFRNNFISIIFISISSYVIPNLGPYDVKNAIFYISDQLFEFIGIITIKQPHNMTIFIALFILFITSSLSIALNLFISIKRSSYNC